MGKPKNSVKTFQVVKTSGAFSTRRASPSKPGNLVLALEQPKTGRKKATNITVVAASNYIKPSSAYHSLRSPREGPRGTAVPPLQIAQVESRKDSLALGGEKNLTGRVHNTETSPPPSQLLSAIITPRERVIVQADASKSKSNSRSSLYLKEKVMGKFSEAREDSTLLRRDTYRQALAATETKCESYKLTERRLPSTDMLSSGILTKPPILVGGLTGKENGIGNINTLQTVMYRTSKIMKKFKERESLWCLERAEYLKEIQELRNRVKSYELLLKPQTANYCGVPDELILQQENLPLPGSA